MGGERTCNNDVASGIFGVPVVLRRGFHDRKFDDVPKW